MNIEGSSQKFTPPLFEIPPALKEKVNQLTNAANQKILFLEENYSGNTIVHEVVQLHDYRLFKLIFKEGTPYINIPNAQGSTPLHQAVLLGDEHLVRELLSQGAMDSINAPDQDGLTPKQIAIIKGQVNIVREMLESSPKARVSINQPDPQFYITDLQRAARSGNLEMMSLLLYYSVEAEPYGVLLGEEVEACLASSERDLLEDFPIEKIAFPLTIAQNFCSVMIRLDDGKILRLRHSDAKEVRNHLMQKKYGADWQNDQGSNALIAYLDPGHAFVRLECRNCQEDKPYAMSQGFYPGLQLTAKGPAKRQYTEEAKLIFNILGQDSYLSSINQYILSYLKFQFAGIQIGEIREEAEYEKIANAYNSLKIMFYLDDSQAKAALSHIKEVSISCNENPEHACIYEVAERNCVDFVQEVFQTAGGIGHFVDYFSDAQLGYGHLLTPYLIPYIAIDYGYVRSRGIPHYLQASLTKTANVAYNALGVFTGTQHNTYLQAHPLPSNIITISPFQAPVQDELTTQINRPYELFAENLLLVATIGKLASNCFYTLKETFLRTIGPKASPKDVKDLCSEYKGSIELTLDKLVEVEEAIDEAINQVNEDIYHASLKDDQGRPIESLYEDAFQKNKMAFLEEKQQQLYRANAEWIELNFQGMHLEDQLNKLESLKSLPTKKFLETLETEMQQYFLDCHQFLSSLSSTTDPP